MKKILIVLLLLTTFTIHPQAYTKDVTWDGGKTYKNGWSEWSLKDDQPGSSVRATVYIPVNTWNSEYSTGGTETTITTVDSESKQVKRYNGSYNTYRGRDSGYEETVCNGSFHRGNYSGGSGCYCLTDSGLHADQTGLSGNNPTGYCMPEGTGLDVSCSDDLPCDESNTVHCYYMACRFSSTISYSGDCNWNELSSNSEGCGTHSSYRVYQTSKSFKDKNNKSNWKKSLSDAGGYALKVYIYSYPLSFKVKFDGNGATGSCEFENGSNTYSNATNIKYDKGNPVCKTSTIKAKGSMDIQEIDYQKGGNLAQIGYYRYGYDFVGWAGEPNATVAKFSNGAKVTATDLAAGPGDTITLYAVWKKHTYSITFEKLCGTIANTTYQMGDNKTLDPLVTSSCTDKDVEFLGWYEEPEYENKLDKIPSDYHEDLILYAKERQLRYYDYQDGKWKITNK